MDFIDDVHKEYYEKFILKSKIREYDNERRSLFYLLSMLKETRIRINDLYNFERNWIRIEGLEASWQTSGSMKVTRLAFNLYNGFIQTEDEENENERVRTTPIDIFSMENIYLECMLNAIRIRFS